MPARLQGRLHAQGQLASTKRTHVLFCFANIEGKHDTAWVDMYRGLVLAQMSREYIMAEKA